MKQLLTPLLAILLTISAFGGGTTVPWSEDFSDINAIRNWPWAKAYSSSRGITRQSPGQLYLAQAATNKYNSVYQWFTADGFALEAGKSYRFDIDSWSNTDAGSKYYTILLYKKGESTPTINDDNTELMKVTDIDLVSKSHSCYFEVTETADYYLCIYAYANYAGRALYWDNMKLVEASMDAPDKPSITATADPAGILKAQVTVTPPAKTIRGDDLTAITKLVVYRDGGEIKTFNSPSLTEPVALTDYVAQPGEHLYSAVAYNDKGAGAQADLYVNIGAAVQEQTYTYNAIFTPEGKAVVQWPAKDGVTSYKVECEGRELTGTPVLDETTNIYSLTDDGLNIGTEPAGWQWDVMQVNDDQSTTHLGYTNYLCLNNEIPYYPTCNQESSEYAFYKDLDPDPDAKYCLGFMNYAGGHLACSLKHQYSTNYFFRNWLVSPGLKLSKDKFYRVKLTACSDYGTSSYTIKAGKGNTRDYLDISVAEGVALVKGGSSCTVLRTDEMFLSVPEDGMYFVGITGDIPDNSSSDYIRIKRFDIIEVDGRLPDVATDVHIGYSTTGGSDGKLSFTLPATAINGTALTGLSKVEIFKNGELFKTITEGVAPGAAMAIDIAVAAGQQDIYTIIAHNSVGQGEPATAKVLVFEAPYSNNFNAKNSLDGYTVLNLLGTSNTFEIYQERVRLYPNDKGNDHWLITPPITLKGGMYYDLTFNIKSKADDAGHLDVMLGKGADPEMMTQKIMEVDPIWTENNIFMGNKDEYFTVEEDGQYFLAFHITTPGGNRSKASEIYIDDLAISAGISGNMPDRGILEVIPASDGSTKAELSYTAATKTLDGSDLNANSQQDVYFYINGVQTPANRTYKAYPGQKVAITVEVPEDLPYIFSARTGWNGRLTYKDAFVGINRPSYPDPDKIVVKEVQPYGTVSMSWEAVTKDYEGYDLYPDLLTYDVAQLRYYTIDGQVGIEEIPMATAVRGTSCEFKACEPTADQQMLRYVIRARNSKGEGSSGALSKYVNVGKPYRMPYRESFGSSDNPGAASAIFYEAFSSWCNWGVMLDGFESFKSADGDGSYLAMESLSSEASGRFYTGKVNLGSGLKPSLTLMVYNHSSASLKDTNTLEFKVITHSDAKEHQLIAATPIDELCNGRPGWNKITVDLSDYADNVVICAVDATCQSHTFTSIDNVRVWELPANDLTLLGHNAPISVTPGENFTTDVTVINNGKDAAAPDAIEMHVDGQLAATAEGGEAIAPGAQAVYQITHAFPAVDMATSHEVVFKAVYADDNDLTDNESAVHTIATVPNNCAPVENLTATADNDLFVTLNWEAPSLTPSSEAIVESFENWEAGAASQHGWTAFDNDGRNIKGLNDGTGNAIVIPGLTAFAPASWAVIDNADGPLPAASFPANSGSKFLMSICPAASSGSADDWFISPRLSGEAQTVKFFLRNMNGYRAGIEVLCSTGAMSLNSFTTVVSDAVNNPAWTEASVDLPEGTTRVAFRNISYCEESFMLMIDDITYQPAAVKTDDLLGYNVYLEGEALAQPQGCEFKTPEAVAEGTYTYGVSARYAHGESSVTPVEVTVKYDGISATVADGVHVFGGSGCIHVTGAEGKHVAVSDMRGVLLCNGTMGSENRIAAAAGMYIVTVDNRSYKVIVK